MNEFLSDTSFLKFRNLIYRESGISFSGSNRSVLAGRLKEKLYSLKISHVDEYYEILLNDKEEIKAFLDLVTTNLTRFFRNPTHFETLERFVIPNLIKYKSQYEPFNKTITVWSAGCSTGEEPYSLAMTLKECLPFDFNFKIYASDLSLKSLMAAQKGFYLRKRVKEEVNINFLRKYFEKKDSENYEIVSELKKAIHFDYHNLKNESHFKNIDIVFCRNVLIYFDEVSQRNTLMNFWEAMTGYSYFFIGHSESLFSLNVPFKYYKTPYAIVYVKNIKDINNE